MDLFSFETFSEYGVQLIIVGGIICYAIYYILKMFLLR